MSSLRALVLILPLAAGCVGNIQRSARVPHPSVPLSSGQPLGAPAEVSAGLSSVTDLVKPAVGNASEAVEVPATQMRNELRFRIAPRAQLALIYERGFASTTQQPDSTQAPVGPGDVTGYGASLGYSFATSTPGLAIGTTVELMGWTVPYVEYETCTNCIEPFTTVEHGTASPMTLGVGIAPTYRRGRMTYFGGAFARNHPTTLRKELNTDITFDDGDGDVRSGPFNLLLHAGVEVELQRCFPRSSSCTRTSSRTPCSTAPASASHCRAASGWSSPHCTKRTSQAVRSGTICPLVNAPASRRFGIIGLACCLACAGRKEPPGPPIQVLGESMRWRSDEPLPHTSPWFDGTQVTLVAARGETLGLQVFHRAPGSSTLRLTDPSVQVQGFATELHVVSRPSTAMYGGSRGKGSYPDALTASAEPTTNPAYFEVAVARDATPGERTGELVVAGQRIPVRLSITEVTLPAPRLDVWAYGDPRELAWAQGRTDQPAKANAGAPTPVERACIAMFREHGVMLSPDMTVETYATRKDLLAGFAHVPALIPDDPAKVGEVVRAWIAATAGTGQIPFVIPIDEPRPESRAKVRALAEAVRAAGGGPTTFRFAVTDEPRPEYGDFIDLYISWNAAHLTGDRHDRWTYNGKPPIAGSMTLDAESPGMRTWGWIGWRWNIPVWYVWDALYWHDRHNRKGAPLPGRALDPTNDAVSFSDGEDGGNFDGVLTLPGPDGCRRTLRLATIRRGIQDRALLELAARCSPEATATLAAELIPRALGDAPKTGKPAWPTDEAAWENARRNLLGLAKCNASP